MGKDKLNASFADVDRSLTQLAVLINQVPPAKAASGATLSKMDYAYNQLGGALGTGDKDVGRTKRRLTKLSEAIDDSTEDLRTLCVDQIFGDNRSLDRASGVCARSTPVFAPDCEMTPTRTLSKKSYAAMADRWTDSSRNSRACGKSRRGFCHKRIVSMVAPPDG